MRRKPDDVVVVNKWGDAKSWDPSLLLKTMYDSPKETVCCIESFF